MVAEDDTTDDVERSRRHAPDLVQLAQYYSVRIDGRTCDDHPQR